MLVSEVRADPKPATCHTGGQTRVGAIPSQSNRGLVIVMRVCACHARVAVRRPRRSRWTSYTSSTSACVCRWVRCLQSVRVIKARARARGGAHAAGLRVLTLSSRGSAIRRRSRLCLTQVTHWLHVASIAILSVFMAGALRRPSPHSSYSAAVSADARRFSWVLPAQRGHPPTAARRQASAESWVATRRPLHAQNC